MGLPNWVNQHQSMLLRISEKNPLDISTIISIYPDSFSEKKPMMPEWYHVKAGSYENPSFLMCEGASSWREMSDTNQVIEIPISSVSVVESVIRDWMIGIYEVVPGVAQPGVFFLPGRWDIEKLRKDSEASEILNRANELQKAWLLRLVNAADSLWAKSNGNPRTISDLMKMSANILNMKDKPWMKNFQMAKMSNCPACGNMVMPGFPVCANCKTVVDEEAYKRMGFKHAV